MSVSTPNSAPPPKKSRGKQETESLQAANEELKAKLSDVQNELQQERGKVCKLRERLQELRAQREAEQHRHAVAQTELRVKLREEKQREVAAVRDSLSRQHEAELARAARLRQSELGRLQGLVNALRNGGNGTAELREEAREEARRNYEAERLKLTQELQEAKAARRQAEEALTNAVQADKAKAADLRVAHQAHQEEIQRIKRDSQKEVRRLMEELRGRDRVVQTLEKELGVQAGQTQRLLLQKEEAERHHGSPKREVAPALGENTDAVLNQEVDERDTRRFQLKIAELQAVIRKLEDRNTLLSDERTELLKRVRETDGQMKPLLEKNRRMSKKNEELLQTLQRMEDKLKSLSRENAELKEKTIMDIQQTVLKRTSSLTDLSHAHEEQEVEFLRLQVNEQRNVIEELTQERDRLIFNKKNKRKNIKLPKRHVVETYFGFDEESIDSETSSLTSYNTDHTPATPEEELEEAFSREEAELRFRQLTREYQALQRAYALLQETTGPLDPERHCRTRDQLQAELNACQARNADLERSLAEKGQDSKWVEEKQNLIRINQELREKIELLEQSELRLRSEVRDTQDQNELLEFRILELEERERRSPAYNLHISTTENSSSLQLHCQREGIKVHTPTFSCIHMQDVIIPELMKKLDILGDNGNLRNEEQVTVIQASTVLSRCEKWLKQIDSTEAALAQKMIDLENEKELFSKQKGFLEEELDYRKQALDHANLRVQELEATLYAVLQQDPNGRLSESLSERQRAELAESMEAVRRQILRQSRHADTLILQQRMELLQSAQQRIRELEDKIDMQRRQIKEIEEKVCIAAVTRCFYSDGCSFESRYNGMLPTDLLQNVCMRVSE
ncbi:janus kinase and microtubule-interacting protein 1 isoform X1 [Hemibagrus wyckioides]|uniref:janus kinase and microtubule-interacting protein 1 isoform X1 n=1 Tax=Hemibagrus wyckioides TaxID=337641 RepID=UPI00266B8651|nr:janus kinase and microtubule-interacting protein 1 isoform X1 [Hemibagrus wyckioides]XP_058254046.1 janus kinase and microtubule-interacting protein 1 isoform X1 [Hemibagrus wyckioides]XP_058254047.1 janus kinase and microtubule-interacting protein 1 isoform X1 [Hemibagrus wyckioides]XP_058254048.1 janus kinase and microtubule-interacting protein 1 isoform X1 [Hemibagrus wyckioides]